MKRFILGAAVFGLLLGPVGQANAALIAVTNSGFEAFTLTDGQYVDLGGTPIPPGLVDPNPIPGWMVSGTGAGTFNPTTTHYAGEASEGFNVAYSNGPTISQLLAAVLTLGSSYILQVDVGNRLDEPFAGYAVQLFAGGSLLAQENSLSPLSGTFATSTLTYTPLASDLNLGMSLEVRLLSSGVQANFDNVRLNAATPTPEPGTLLLLGTGFVGMGTMVRRRNRRDGK